MEKLSDEQTLNSRRSLSLIHSPSLNGQELDFRGKKIADNLTQLTGTFLKKGDRRHNIPEFSDPAPPYLNPNTGKIEIFGSASYYLVYNSWADFLNGGNYDIETLPLQDPSGRLLGTEVMSHAWDVRKYRIIQTGEELVVGGAMANPKGTWPKWPYDNPRRRIFLFRNLRREAHPLFGELHNHWADHSYGGNYFQSGVDDPNWIDLDKPLYLFFEKVSQIRTDGWPDRTEMFVMPMKNPFESAGAPQPLLAENSTFPSMKRGDGGALMEGGRPFEIELNGRKYFILGFSCGDFCTDRYTGNFAYSEKIDSGWKPLTNSAGDLIDYFAPLRERFHLSWTGRPVLFFSPDSEVKGSRARVSMMFHAVDRRVLPHRDYQAWPKGKKLFEFYRFLLLTQMEIVETSPGELEFKVLVD